MIWKIFLIQFLLFLLWYIRSSRARIENEIIRDECENWLSGVLRDVGKHRERVGRRRLKLKLHESNKEKKEK